MDKKNSSQSNASITRREMLKLMGATTVGVALAGCSPTAAPTSPPAAVQPPAAPAPTKAPAAVQPTDAPAPTKAPAVINQTYTVRWQESNIAEAAVEPIWKAAIPEFEKENPNIKIEPVIVARVDHWTKFITAAKAKQAPDVIGYTSIIGAAYSGWLRPIDDLWKAEPESFRSAFPKGSIDGTTWKGKQWGLPSWGGIFAEFYNKDIIKEVGLDINKPPATYDEYLTWMKAMTKPGQRWGTAILGGRTDTTTRIILMWIWSNGGQAFNQDRTEATFAKDPKALEAIEYYLNLDLVHKVVSPDAVNTNYVEQTLLYAQGKIGAMRSAYWAVAKVIGDNPAIKDKIFVAFPPMKNNAKATMSYVYNDSITADCKNPEAAWKWIKFWNNKKYSVKRITDANITPIRTDVMDDPALKDDKLLAQFMEYGKVGVAYPDPHPRFDEIATGLVVDAVQAALLKKGTIKEVFTKLDADTTKVLKDI